MKKPNFFIIGGAKCGTGSLSAYLREHPDILFTDPKVYEPCYFSPDISELNRNVTTLEEYLDCWSGDMENYIAVGEKSVTYIVSQVAVQNILKFNPDAKFIVMIRNPVDMAYSLHAQLACFDYEDVTDFKQAWSLQSARAQGLNMPRNCLIPAFLQYGISAKFGEQLERLYKQVSKNKVKVILFDEFKSNTPKTYQEVLAFLGVPSYTPKEFVHKNRNSKARSILLFRALILIAKLRKFLGVKRSFGLLGFVHNLNNKKLPREKLDDKFIDELISYFREDVEKLSQLTEKDLSFWLDKTYFN
jgi:hypothetical protein